MLASSYITRSKEFSMPDSTMVDPSAWAGMVEKAVPVVVSYGFKLLAAILIYLVGKWVAKLITEMLRKLMLRSKVDASLVGFVCNLIYAVLLIFVVIAAIGKIGVQTTSFIAIIGAAGLAVGMSLQGSLSNFAAGEMLILMKPFKLGDTITAAGVTGKVYDIGVFHSAILTSDNRKIIVPNAKLSGDSITNFTAMPTRRVELSIVVPGSTDIGMVRELLIAVIGTEDKVLPEPKPSVTVSSANAAEISLDIFAHVNNDDLSSVKNSLTEKIKIALSVKGIWV